MCDVLVREGEEDHPIVTIFDAPPAVLRAEVALGVPPGILRRLGLDPRAVRSLRRWVKAHRPRAVVAHGGEAFKYAALACPRGLPVIYYRIGAVLPKARRQPSLGWHAALARRAARIVCVSEDMRRETAQLWGLPPAALPVIANARDSAIFHPAARRERRSEVVVGFVGELAASKRPGWLIDAVTALRAEGFPVRGLAVGDGPLMTRLSADAANSDVDLLGRSAEVPERLREMDVLLLPSTRQEGLPGVLIEAALSGLPIVATDAPGVRDVVLAGETGFVVGIDDQQAALVALRTLVADPALRARMGAAARAHCEERFSLSASAKEWGSVIAGVTARRQ